ncbi:MAG: hypothetical protein ACM31D_13480 [Bacteroidota bacterium]
MRAAVLMVLALSACAPMAARDDGLPLPAGLAGKVVVLAPTDAAYGRANVGDAVKSEGQGGVSQALVVQLSQDLPVYRMWNGPVTSGNSNRLGGWWAFDAPRGTREGYRRAYEICGTWNQLVWVATCTLKQGAVVAIGPGQSVSAQTCNDSSGYEYYDANRRDWQVYVNQPWTRPDELSCPPETADFKADPANVALPLK